MLKKVQKCRDCSFIDNPPLTMKNLETCPYCGGCEWARFRPNGNNNSMENRARRVEETRSYQEEKKCSIQQKT